MRIRMELLRAKDVAPMLGVGTRRVLQLRREGRLPAVRAGRRGWRFPRMAVEACFKRWTEQALGDMVSMPPPVATDQALANAVHQLAVDSPMGWTGTATELHDRLDRYREDEGRSERWPLNGQSLGVAIRRLIAHLGKNGVLVVMGRRGHRGRRLISITEVDSVLAEAAPSAASHPDRGAAAPGAGRGSSRMRRGRGGGEYTGVLTVDAELLAESSRRTGVGGPDAIESGREEDVPPARNPLIGPGEGC